jgi:hypothetical protein
MTTLRGIGNDKKGNIFAQMAKKTTLSDNPNLTTNLDSHFRRDLTKTSLPETQTTKQIIPQSQ